MGTNHKLLTSAVLAIFCLFSNGSSWAAETGPEAMVEMMSNAAPMCVAPIISSNEAQAEQPAELAPGTRVIEEPLVISKKEIRWNILKEKLAAISRKVRLDQAKELLGKHYRKSIVRGGEKVKSVEKFVLEQTRNSLPERWKKKATKLTKSIMMESRKYGFDPIFLMAVIMNESSFNPETRGGFGEIGLMQIKPDTAKWIAKIFEMKYHGPRQLEDPSENVKLGAAFLSYLRGKFDNHSRLYLSAYNMGPGNVNSALGRNIWPKEYASRVMEHYIRYYTELTKPARQAREIRAPEKSGKKSS